MVIFMKKTLSAVITLAMTVSSGINGIALAENDLTVNSYYADSNGVYFTMQSGVSGDVTAEIDVMYKVTKEDMINGVRHRDGICRVRFCVDVHATNKNSAKGYADEGIHTKPYDIPLRALIAKDVKGLIIAGRCISGDFHSHASYRVSGEAGTIGEVAGVLAAAAVKNGLLPNEVEWDIVYPMFDSEFLPND